MSNKNLILNSITSIKQIVHLYQTGWQIQIQNQKIPIEENS